MAKCWIDVCVHQDEEHEWHGVGHSNALRTLEFRLFFTHEHLPQDGRSFTNFALNLRAEENGTM